MSLISCGGNLTGGSCLGVLGLICVGSAVRGQTPQSERSWAEPGVLPARPGMLPPLLGFGLDALGRGAPGRRHLELGPYGRSLDPRRASDLHGTTLARGWCQEEVSHRPSRPISGLRWVSCLSPLGGTTEGGGPQPGSSRALIGRPSLHGVLRGRERSAPRGRRSR